MYSSYSLLIVHLYLVCVSTIITIIIIIIIIVLIAIHNAGMLQSVYNIVCSACTFLGEFCDAGKDAFVIKSRTVD